MSNLNIAVIGPDGFAKELGKKGTSTDITFYNMKKGNVTLTLIEPSRYPEKLSSLFYTASLAEKAIVVIDAVTAKLGECILMLNAAGVSGGYLILRNYIDISQIMPLIKGTVLEKYEQIEDDMVVLRERLFHDASSLPETLPENPGIVPIDHHFNVKGIGTVILGCVNGGTIKKHDQLNVFPINRTCQVRSIQMHDDDTDIAGPGARVGIALKGIESDDLDRGYVLSADKNIKVALTVTGKAEIIPYWPEPLKEQMVVYAGHWMQFLPARITNIENGDNWHLATITLSFEREFIYIPGNKIVLHYLENEKLRIVGVLTL